MFARVQVEHELDQSSFQPRAGAGKTNETASAQLRRAFEIKEFEIRSNGDVIQRTVEFRFRSPRTHNRIGAGILPARHLEMRQIGNLQKHFFLFRVYSIYVFV